MNELTAEVHLKRAYELISQVDRATEQFRSSAIAHNEYLDEDQPFLQMMVTGIKGKRQLQQQKSTLLSDLKLASEELDRAAVLNAEARVETSDGQLGGLALRAMASYATGQLELIYGTSKKAKEIFTSTIEIADIAEPHYMLGLIYEDEYKPAEALREFEKCLELDPSGELSVPALREANAMRNYKKKFRGNWLLLVFLLLLYIIPGVIYFKKKYK